MADSEQGLHGEERRPDDVLEALRRMEEAFQGRLADIQQVAQALRNEMQQRETTLHTCELLLAGILDIADEAIISIDENQDILVANRGAEETFGYTSAEMLRCPLSLLLPERFNEALQEHLRDFATGTDTRRRMGEARQVFGRRKNGTQFPAEASISKTTRNDRTIFSVVLRDITRRKEAEEEVKNSRGELRALAARLQQVREEERASLARTIHDELSGALTALTMELSLLPSRVTQELAQVVKQNATPMSQEIQRILERVRIIATELRPAVLDQLGLLAALEWEAQQFERRTGMRCEITLPDEEITLGRDRSTAVFRICQEALTNVALHAQATKAIIKVSREDGNLILEIEDDGKGVEQSEIVNLKSLGLLGMRERALAFGGELQISGAPRPGTLIRLKIPIG
jgi:PAS domain S-box-containing protein